MKSKKVLPNLLWRYAERSISQLIAFIVSIVLARLLSPEDYGTVALVGVFTTILQVFVDCGLGTSLIQKKNADDLDFSSVFYFNMIICIILYLVMFFGAPFIAMFYNRPELKNVVRIISFTIIISGVKGIQQAYVSRNMMFKKFFFSTLGGTIVSAVIGIGMAYAGFGIWALIGQQLSNMTIDTIILWITVKWRPKKSFSFDRLKMLLNYGWKLMLSALLDVGYTNFSNLLIGKIYSPSELAFYNQAEKFPKEIVYNINSSIDSVLLPTLSMEQDSKDTIKSMTRRAIKTCTYIMTPIMMGFAYCAKSIINIILSDKWMPAVPYVAIFCFVYMLWPIHTINLNAIKAMGRSDLFLKMEVVKKVIGIALLLITSKISVMAMALSMIISTLVSMVINAWPNQKLLGYGVRSQLLDVLPSILLSVVMICGISVVRFLKLQIIFSLVLEFILGILIYVGLSAIIGLDEFKYVVNIIMDFLKK